MTETVLVTFGCSCLYAKGIMVENIFDKEMTSERSVGMQ